MGRKQPKTCVGVSVAGGKGFFAKVSVQTTSEKILRSSEKQKTHADTPYILCIVIQSLIELRTYDLQLPTSDRSM